MSDSQSKVVFVIITHDGEQWIEDCLASIEAWGSNHEIVIVDNSSSDGTLDIINRHPNIHLEVSSKNLGFGQANNRGIATALNKGADYIFLLNQDARIQVETLQKLLAVLEKDKKIGVVSPIHLDWEGKEIDGHTASYYTNHTLRLIDDYRRDEVKQYYDFSFMPAAAWLVKANVFRKIGGFDPVFFHRGEDVDFVYRLRWHGYRFVLATEAFVCHAHQGAIDFRNKTLASKVEKVKFRTVGAWVTLKRLDKPLLAQLLVLVGESLSMLFRQLASGKWSAPFAEALLWWFVITKLPTVCSSRSCCRNEQGSWISL